PFCYLGQTVAATMRPGQELALGGGDSRVQAKQFSLLGRAINMSQSPRPERWLRRIRRSLLAMPTRQDRRSNLRVVRLEDRVNPVNVANPLVNTPEANQSTLTGNFTQNETSTITIGNTVLATFNDSGSNSTGSRFTGWARSTDGGQTFTDQG